MVIKLLSFTARASTEYWAEAEPHVLSPLNPLVKSSGSTLTGREERAGRSREGAPGKHQTPLLSHPQTSQVPVYFYLNGFCGLQ